MAVFLLAPAQFGRIAFLSFLAGSLDENIMSFLEKALLYCTMIWLLGRTGVGLLRSTILVAVMLFASRWAANLPARPIS